MSNALDTRKQIQSLLGVTADGVFGRRTRAAFDALAAARGDWPEKAAEAPMPELPSDPVDERSERNIRTLHPRVQPVARELVRRSAKEGITIKVTSGTRTYEEQNALYAQGRSKPGKIVTNARGGYSNHNFGIAFDVTIFNGPNPVWESPNYKRVGTLGKQLGLEWGGDWKSIKDEPHFELRPDWAKGMSNDGMLAELRARRNSGKDVFQ